MDSPMPYPSRWNALLAAHYSKRQESLVSVGASRASACELIAARLIEALARGCDLATASTASGSASQRNYERMGFTVAYTKVTLVG